MKKIFSFIFALMFFVMTANAYEINSGLPDGIMLTGGEAQSASDPDDAQNTVIKFSASSTAVLWIPVEKINGGIIELSYNFRFENQGSNIIQLPMLTADKTCLFIPQYHKSGLAINNNGTMNYFGTYNEDTWYTFRYVVDTEALSYDVYVNGRRICKNYGFSTAVLSETDGIKLQISAGTVYIDDITVTKIGEGSARTILFNSDYNVDHNNMTFGRFPYRTTKNDVLDTIRIKNGAAASVNSASDYIADGDKLIIYDSLYNKTYTYTLKIRTKNISKSFFNVMKNSIVLKEDASFGYVNSELKNGICCNNGLIKKDILNIYGINTSRDLSISEINALGAYAYERNGFVIIQKNNFNFLYSWLFDLEKLF